MKSLLTFICLYSSLVVACRASVLRNDQLPEADRDDSNRIVVDSSVVRSKRETLTTPINTRINNATGPIILPSFSTVADSSIQHSITGRLPLEPPDVHISFPTVSISSGLQTLSALSSANADSPGSVSGVLSQLPGRVSQSIIPPLAIPSVMLNLPNFQKTSFSRLNDHEEATHSQGQSGIKSTGSDGGDFLGLNELRKNVLHGLRNLFESNSKFVRQMVSLIGNPSEMQIVSDDKNKI